MDQLWRENMYYKILFREHFEFNYPQMPKQISQNSKAVVTLIELPVFA